jgi:hypothetical protein
MLSEGGRDEECPGNLYCCIPDDDNRGICRIPVDREASGTIPVHGLSRSSVLDDQHVDKRPAAAMVANAID